MYSFYGVKLLHYSDTLTKSGIHGWNTSFGRVVLIKAHHHPGCYAAVQGTLRGNT